ncbi:MAG: hypothetical protein Q8R07_04570, partial [Candidatus Uhrbacteria bacterium]|nr:hypothetical protein [Candidatus Uhrbacteria bacterium]
TPTPTPAPTPTVVYGCTDSKATNYNSNATNDNGTCTYPKPAPAPTVIYGCTDSKATNYNFSATHDDGSCIFPKPASQPSSNIVYGCTDRSATNFNSSATHGDGSCLFSTNQKEASAQPSIVNNTVVNIQQTAVISITQIQMNHLYYLPESKTTNLKQVNPARVNNFALDRVGMMSFIFLGQTNLSTKSAVDTFQRLDDVVHMDSYYFWFEWRFWILFKKDVNCTFYDSAKLLTANSPVTINGKTLNKNEYKVEVLKDGEKSVTIKADTVTQYVKEGERIEIAMKPSLTTNLIPDQSVTTDVQKFVLMGTSTDPNANIFVAFHGEKIELAVNKDGTFQKTFMLEEGVNEMRVSAYRAANTEPFDTVRGMIELEQKREKLALWIKLVIGGVAALLATIAAIWFWKLRKRKRS